MTIYLAHGASGSVESMQAHVEGLTYHGLKACAVGLPIGRAERAVEAYRAQVVDLPTAIIGGHSFGGRVASLLAADEPPRGLVLLSYPLHRPGRPDEPRTEHWPLIACPILILSGEADPFAQIDLLRSAVAEQMSNAELHTYPRVGHGLTRVLDDALSRIERFARSLS